MADERKNDTRLKEESLAELLSRLIVNIKALINAEFGRQRAVLLRRMVKARYALIFAVAAALLAQAAFVVFLVGILLVLGTMIGIAWATGIVTLAALIIAVGRRSAGTWQATRHGGCGRRISNERHR